MNFSVPQYIDIEDKLVGPLTFKQFIYITGGGGLVFIVWRFLPLIVALPIMVIVAAFSLSLAFYRVNSQPFITIVISAIKYYTSNKLYLWKRRMVKINPEEHTIKLSSKYKAKEGSLKEMAMALEINMPPKQ